MKDRLPLFAAALWWGSLTAVGCWVVPMLFTNLPTPAMAGNMAARLFSAQTWVAMGCGLAILGAARRPDDDGQQRMASWAHSALPLIVGGMLLALLSEFVVSPRIVARENLRLWHGAGSLMLVLQWLASGTMLWRLARR